MDLLYKHFENNTRASDSKEESELYKALVGRRPGRPTKTSYIVAQPETGHRSLLARPSVASEDSFGRKEELSSYDRVAGYTLSIPDTDQPLRNLDEDSLLPLRTSYARTSPQMRPLASSVLTGRHIVVSEDTAPSQQTLRKRLDIKDLKQEVFLENVQQNEYEGDVIMTNYNVQQDSEGYITSSSPLPNIVSHSTRSFDIKYEYDPSEAESSSRAHSVKEEDHLNTVVLQRSFSDDGCYSVEKIGTEPATCVPLDLSTKSANVTGVSYDSSHPDPLQPSAMDCSTRPAPKMSLLQLADAVSYIIENDPQSSEAFHSSSSSPSSICDSNSSHSINLEGKSNLEDCVDSSTDSQDYLPGSPEASLDGCIIKCEMADSFRADEGIVLNSNVINNVYSTGSVYYSDDKVEEMPHEGRLSRCEDMNVHDDSLKHSYYSTDPSNGWSSSFLADSKRRLRLAKAEYESMSEEDRRVRHRVLDNQRSKQYRERRRKMVSTLQDQIGTLEQENHSLSLVMQSLQRRADLMRRIISRTNLGNPLNTRNAVGPLFVKTEC